jgi:hypothetical protein
VVDLCSLAKELDGRTLRPDPLQVRVGSVSDRLLVRMVTGQSIGDYERACPELAASLNGHLARVWSDEPGRLWLEVIRDDALAEVVPAQPIPDNIARSIRSPWGSGRTASRGGCDCWALMCSSPVCRAPGRGP